MSQITVGASHLNRNAADNFQIDYMDIIQRANTPHDLSSFPFNTLADKRSVKEQCWWCIPSDCPTKQKSAMISHGGYSLLIADLDYSDYAQQAIIDALMLVGIEAYLIYDTVSSTAECRRSRVVIPLAESVVYENWIRLQRALTFMFKADDAMDNANQISYLPTLSAANKDCYHVSTGNGALLDPFNSAFAHQAIELAQSHADDAESHKLPQPDPVKIKPNPTNGHIDPITEFNQVNDWSDLLRHCGFKKGYGNRWIAPNSSSGVAGVTISTKYRSEGGYVSSHSSDPLADGKLHDKFDVWCAYGRPGVPMGKVLREFAESHYLSSGLTLQKHNQKAYVGTL